MTQPPSTPPELPDSGSPPLASSDNELPQALLPPAFRRPRVKAVGWQHPLRWLRLGWVDLLRCPGPGLAHGMVAALFGLAVLWFARDDFWIMAGAFSGFLIVAPIVATGLYAISRGLQHGHQLGLAGVLRIWWAHDGRLVHFGLLLALAGTGWVFTSAAMITSFTDVPITRPLDFLRYVVVQDSNWLFEAWLMMGGVLVAPVFASTVVAIPLLLDRKSTVLQAVLTSWDAVLAAPGPLALWAGLLMALSLLGMATLMLGLVVVVPWLAHASWHAYCDLVEPTDTAGAGAN
jgi:uncharacterized membrane protein